MHQPKTNIKELVRECESFLRQLNYSEACIAVHRRQWNDGIIPYMESRGITGYNPVIGADYLASATKDSAPSTKRARTRNIHILDEYLATGNVRRRIVHLVDHPLPGEIGEIAQSYLDHLKDIRRSEGTILNHKRMLSYFIAGLTSKGKTHLCEIDERDILDFVDNTQVAKDHHFYTIRQFCKYLYEHGHVTRNLGYVVERANFPQKEKLPSVYSAEEVKQIESSVEQSSKVGKRDYAILLLASRLGLRVSDIAGLTFDNIDWDNNRIVLRQHKTGNPIELPLLPEVGEAIVTYLRYSRPVSKLPNVFLSACAPYRPMNRLGLNGVVLRIMRGSGVNLEGRKFGPHSMRHSLASNMLKSGASISIISEALGHESSETTREYLRIDVTSLGKCALDVTPVPEFFYNQNGGAFYD